jgi:protoheme IX farnesyltransferase
MLPVTHGEKFTRLHVLFYTIILLAVSILPVTTGMGGWIYLASALVLGGIFIAYGWGLWRNYSDELAKRAFRFSLWYLSLLFAAMLVDHYFKFPLAA